MTNHDDAREALKVAAEALAAAKEGKADDEHDRLDEALWTIRELIDDREAGAVAKRRENLLRRAGRISDKLRNAIDTLDGDMAGDVALALSGTTIDDLFDCVKDAFEDLESTTGRAEEERDEANAELEEARGALSTEHCPACGTPYRLIPGATAGAESPGIVWTCRRCAAVDARLAESRGRSPVPWDVTARAIPFTLAQPPTATPKRKRGKT